MPSRPIEDVLADKTDEWMAVRGVVGTGIGECDSIPCIRIFVNSKKDDLRGKLPKQVEGYVVDIVETGTFRPRDSQG